MSKIPSDASIRRALTVLKKSVQGFTTNFGTNDSKITFRISNHLLHSKPKIRKKSKKQIFNTY